MNMATINIIIISFQILIIIGIYILYQYIKRKENANQVHFYITKDKYDERLMLWIGKPRRCAAVWGYTATSHTVCYENYFGIFGLNPQVYKDIKWENEPVEVFIRLKD